MSDIQLNSVQIVSEGNTIAYRWIIRMKHTGRTQTLQAPATNKNTVLKGCPVVHLSDGKIVEEFEY
jgi:hypothetical protein